MMKILLSSCYYCVAIFDVSICFQILTYRSSKLFWLAYSD